MKVCGKKLRADIVIILVAAVGLFGCTATSYLSQAEQEQWTPELILHSYLDRWVEWESMSSEVKLTVQTGDSSFSARGHLLYLVGERYKVGFARPYNRILGDLYISPTHIIFWNPDLSEQVYAAQDTIVLSELLPVEVPNWDPRDLLPFPVSGRTSGFQIDSLWCDESYDYLSGYTDDARYLITIAPNRGTVISETISRSGRDPICKVYSKVKRQDGWPVALRATCYDSLSGFKLKWKLSGLDLEARSFRLPTASN